MFCPNCGKEIVEIGVTQCPYCQQIIASESQKEPVEPVVISEPAPEDWLSAPVKVVPEEPAWERRGEIGYGVAFFKTLGSLLVHPGEVFRYLNPQKTATGALIFALILGSFATVIGVYWQIAADFIMYRYMEEPSSLQAEFGVNAYAILMVVIIFIAPILTFVSLFINSGIYHVLLLILAKPQSFWVTLRVYAYAHATAIFVLLPICGSFIYAPWMLFVMVVGLREAHHTTTTRAVLVVLLPIIILCGCVSVFFGVIFTMMLMQNKGFDVTALLSYVASLA